MAEKGSEKRRSDRLMLTLPLIVEGTDSKGESFESNARTITINRHGARIISPHPLRAGQTIRVTNLASKLKCQFRVVGPVAPATERGGEWGIECSDPKDNIWGIQFPPVPIGEDGQSKALLECRECGATALMPISHVEVEVLETSGILTKHCTSCERETRWGVSEKQAVLPQPAGGEPRFPANKTSGGGIENRKHRRSALQMPVLVRDYYGGSEITKTENISRGGFCFVSEKKHQVGEILVVVCPYDPAAQRIEIRARVVRCTTVEGSARQVYGVRYER